MTEKSTEMDILKQLKLPPLAEDWLSDLWDTIQFFDDLHDNDETEDSDKILWKCLVDLPNNSFFRAHQDILMPLIVTQIMKWTAANDMEEAGEADETSFMYRAGFFEIVLMVAYLVHGRDINPRGALLYGEKYDKYKEEFKDRD